MHRAWLLILLGSMACDVFSGPDNNPSPTISGFWPEYLTADGSGKSVVIEGNGFVKHSVVFTDQVAHDGVTFISARKLRVALADSEVAFSGTITVQVFNPPPSGGVSEPLALEIHALVPALTSLDQPEIFAGPVLDTVIVRGTNLLRNSVGQFNGAPRPTIWLNAATLAVILNEADLKAAGLFNINVANPPPGGGTSNLLPLRLVNGVPAITLLPSQGAHAGGPGFSLLVHGRGFVVGSTVQWNGTDRPTQYLSSTRLMAEVSPANVASAGTGSITVVNPAPAGGASEAAVMTVRLVPPSTFTSSNIMEGLSARDLAPDDQRGVIYVSIGSSGRTDANSVIALDPMTQSITRRLFVGSEPGRLARSSDGQFLYVGLDGASAVRRVYLGGLTAGPQWSLPAGEIAGEIRVLPGRPLSVVVSRQRPGTSPPLTGVTIYDDGVARPQSGPGHTGGNRIEFLEKPDTLYGYNNSHTGFEFFTISIDPSGAQYAFTTGGLIAGFDTQITGAAGRIYGTDGSIVDAERRVRIGSFPIGSLSTAVDPILGRAFLLLSDRIAVYDLNTYQLLGTFPIAVFSPVSYPHLVRWGTDGLAFVDTDHVFLVRSPLFGP